MIGWAAALWACVVAGVLLVYRRDLLAVWREPVVRYPVLIFEGDDWGAGAVAPQVHALNELAAVLARHCDCTGRHPVMTLALVLAVADGPAILLDGRYRRRELDDALFAPLRAAIERGRDAGVFSLQLHGMEHYWPSALMASGDRSVQDWLVAASPQFTERLPSPLQSRWVDASTLPSRPLRPEEAAAAATEEIQAFERIFGCIPRVAVPPTFVWTSGVERAWAAAGIEFVVTPGLRSACRNAAGMPDCDNGPFRCGEHGEGVMYLVRDDYFEPERGHRAEHALEALAAKGRQGRACLFETHRSNFIGDAATLHDALGEISRLLERALGENSALRFMSTEELGRAMKQADRAWIERRWRPRLVAWVARLQAMRRFWKLSRLTGLAWMLAGGRRLLERSVR